MSQSVQSVVTKYEDTDTDKDEGENVLKLKTEKNHMIIKMIINMEH